MHYIAFLGIESHASSIASPLQGEQVLLEGNLVVPVGLQSANWSRKDQCQRSHAHGFLLISRDSIAVVCVWNFAVVGSPNVEQLSLILRLFQLRIMWVFDEAFLEEPAGKWTPGACRPGGRCQDCYPGALTLGRATAAYLGFGCPMILLPPSFIFGYPIPSWVTWSRGLVLGTMMAGRGGGSGIGCRATCPISFHCIS